MKESLMLKSNENWACSSMSILLCRQDGGQGRGNWPKLSLWVAGDVIVSSLDFMQSSLQPMGEVCGPHPIGEDTEVGRGNTAPWVTHCKSRSGIIIKTHVPPKLILPQPSLPGKAARSHPAVLHHLAFLRPVSFLVKWSQAHCFPGGKRESNVGCSTWLFSGSCLLLWVVSQTSFCQWQETVPRKPFIWSMLESVGS